MTRAIDDDELRALAAGLDDDGYGFSNTRVEVPLTPLQLTVLVGEPRGGTDPR